MAAWTNLYEEFAQSLMARWSYTNIIPDQSENNGKLPGFHITLIKAKDENFYAKLSDIGNIDRAFPLIEGTEKISKVVENTLQSLRMGERADISFIWTIDPRQMNLYSVAPAHKHISGTFTDEVEKYFLTIVSSIDEIIWEEIRDEERYLSLGNPLYEFANFMYKIGNNFSYVSTHLCAEVCIGRFFTKFLAESYPEAYQQYRLFASEKDGECAGTVLSMKNHGLQCDPDVPKYSKEEQYNIIMDFLREYTNINTKTIKG